MYTHEYEFVFVGISIFHCECNVLVCSSRDFTSLSIKIVLNTIQLQFSSIICQYNRKLSLGIDKIKRVVVLCLLLDSSLIHVCEISKWSIWKLNGLRWMCVFVQIHIDSRAQSLARAFLVDKDTCAKPIMMVTHFEWCTFISCCFAEPSSGQLTVWLHNAVGMQAIRFLSLSLSLSRVFSSMWSRSELALTLTNSYLIH